MEDQVMAPLAAPTIRACGLCPLARLNRPVDTLDPATVIS
jgi:hypothetical protein